VSRTIGRLIKIKQGAGKSGTLIKELKFRIDFLSQQNSALQDKNDALRAKIAGIEKASNTGAS
jgi:hypothetical protein